MNEWNRRRLDRLDEVERKPNERTDTTVNVITQQRELRELRGHTRGLTALVAVLLLALAGVGIYGYLSLERLGVPLSQLPGLQDTVSALQERVAAVEQQLASWSAVRDQMSQRVGAVEAKLNRNLQQANQHSQELTAQLHQRMEAELDQRTQSLEARLENLGIDRELERARVEGVEKQVTSLRADTGRDLAVVNDALSRNERSVNELAQQFDRQRVDFELAEDRTQELAPGISLRVTSADVSYQRVKGWLWLLSDRRTLWVRDLQAQQALIFYLRGSDVPHELVITQVTKGGVAGYLLLPANGAASGAAASD